MNLNEKKTDSGGSYEYYTSNSEYLDDLVEYVRLLLDNWKNSSERDNDYIKAVEEKCRKTAETGIFIPMEYLSVRFSLTSTVKKMFYVSIASQRNSELDCFLKSKAENLSTQKFYSDLFGIDIYLIEEALNYIRQSYFFAAERSTKGIEKLRPVLTDFLLEQDYILESTEAFRFFYPQEEAEPLLCHHEVHEMLVNLTDRVSRKSGFEHRLVICIQGDRLSGKKTQIKSLCNDKGMACCFINGARLCPTQDLLSAELFDILLLSLIYDAIPVFFNTDSLTTNISDMLSDSFFNLFPMVFMLSEDSLALDLPESHMDIHISIPLPDRITSQNLWNSYGLKLNPDMDWTIYANKFTFPVGLIKRAVAAAAGIAGLKGRAFPSHRDVTEACYSQINHRLGKVAAKAVSSYTFEDLVLPKQQMSLLRDACSQIMNKHIVYDLWGFNGKVQYGKGLSMLFSGPPGTGKTMAAQVVAHYLDMELYVVNLSMIVSKYVGETEKNIKELFDEAKKSQSIIFFDEADSLFSKRTEVKNSNDKASNMEASFLLQKMEEYDGIIILCTNFIQNFDDAFKRRLKFVIDFPFPGKEYRREIWEKVFPPNAPMAEDMDFEFLAQQFELSGSNIKNIAVNAAFLAAENKSSISMKEVLLSIKQEYAKISKTLTKAEFGQYYILLE